MIAFHLGQLCVQHTARGWGNLLKQRELLKLYTQNCLWGLISGAGVSSLKLFFKPNEQPVLQREEE